MCSAKKQVKSGFTLAAFLALVIVIVAGQAIAAEIKLEWDPSESSGVSGYKVYYGTQSHNYSSSVDAGTQTTYTLTGMADGQTYYFATTAYDSTGAESDFSNEISTTTASAPASGGGSSEGGGGGCFIATAAYGSYMAPEVQLLRDFRDSWLLTNPAGRAFVNAYYQLSPPLADIIRDNEMLRAMARWFLSPAVYAVKYPGVALLLMVLAGVAAVMGCRAAIARRREMIRAQGEN